MKYLCLKCKQIKKKNIFTKTVQKILPTGKIKKVPICCDRKMVLLPKGYKNVKSNNTGKN